MYRTCNALELSNTEIKLLTSLLPFLEWREMSGAQFLAKFENYDFHLLYDDDQIVSVLRVNNAFTFRVKNMDYSIPELVGFTSIIQGKGYGKELITKLKLNLVENNRECIGFCFARNRGFYAKCEVEVFKNAAKFIMEKDGDKWVSSEDDDILNINLSDKSRELILSLGVDSFAYLD